MMKVFIVGLLILVCIIGLVKLLKVVCPPLSEDEKSTLKSVDELSEKASKNYEEREAIKKEVETSEKVLQDIKSRTI
jgi:hypothetical protein